MKRVVIGLTEKIQRIMTPVFSREITMIFRM